MPQDKKLTDSENKISSYIITENDIMPTLKDFEIFYNYIVENKTKLSEVRREIGRNNCFIINGLLSKPRNVDGPKYLQPSYPTINLFFHISLETGIFEIEYTEFGVMYLVPTAKLKEYEDLSSFSKYMFLFRAYWTRLDFRELYFESSAMFSHFMYSKMAFEELVKAKPGERIYANVEDFSNTYDFKNPIHRLFVNGGMIVHHLSVFGFWEYEEAQIAEIITTKKDIYVKAVIPTSLGTVMINGCRNRPYEFYNKYKDEDFIDSNWERESSLKPILKQLDLKRPIQPGNSEDFEECFKQYFPTGAINKKAIENIFKVREEVKTDKTMGNTYIFKVSLNKKTWRRIKIANTCTLQDLHKVILDAFHFIEDHYHFAFFMNGKAWSRNAYWNKMSGRKPIADEVILSKLGLVQRKRIIYIFDFERKWSFEVQLEEILTLDEPLKKSRIIEIRGESPEQYPDVEDYEEDNDHKLLEYKPNNALVHKKSYSDKSDARSDAILWPEINPPFQLVKFLELLSNIELINIRQNLNLKGISRISKKELTELLEKEMIFSLERFLFIFDSNQYKVIKEIMNNNGIARVKLTRGQIDFFRTLGIIFTGTVDGKRVLIIPDEFMSKLNNLDNYQNLHNIVKRNTEWIRISQGLLYYYGALKTSKLIEMVGKYTEKINVWDYMNFHMALINAQKYYGVIINHSKSFSNYQVHDNGTVLEEHNARPTIDFYPFSYDQIYEAGNAGFVDKNYAFNRFSQFIIKHYDITVSEAEKIVEECVYAIRLDEPHKKIIEFLQQHLEINNIELLQEFMEQIVFLKNNTRQWILKGYTPNEIFETEQKKLQPLPESN